MRCTILSAVIILIGIASAQSSLSSAASAVASKAAAFPACAQACLIEAILASSCDITDTKCQCTTGVVEITDKTGACLLRGTCKTSDLAGTYIGSVKRRGNERGQCMKSGADGVCGLAAQSVADAQCKAVLATASGVATSSAYSVLSSAVAGAGSLTTSSGASSASTAVVSTGSAASSVSLVSSVLTVAQSTGAAVANKGDAAVVGLGLLAVLLL